MRFTLVIIPVLDQGAALNRLTACLPITLDHLVGVGEGTYLEVVGAI